jgi:hypothetical protein
MFWAVEFNLQHPCICLHLAQLHVCELHSVLLPGCSPWRPDAAAVPTFTCAGLDTAVLVSSAAQHWLLIASLQQLVYRGVVDWQLGGVV